MKTRAPTRAVAYAMVQRLWRQTGTIDVTCPYRVRHLFWDTVNNELDIGLSCAKGRLAIYSVDLRIVTIHGGFEGRAKQICCTSLELMNWPLPRRARASNA